MSSIDWEQYRVKDNKSPINWEQYSEPGFLERADRKGLWGTTKDVGEGLYDVITGIPEFIKEGAEGLGRTLAQARTNPKRAAQNVGAGLAEYGSHLANIPEAAGKYLKSREYIDEGPAYNFLTNLIPREPRPGMMGSLHIPRPGTYDYAEGIGMEPASFEEEEKADQFMRSIFPLLAGGVPGLAASELGAERNPFGVLAAPTAIKQAVKYAPKAANVAKQTLNKGVEALVKEPYRTYQAGNKLASDIVNNEKSILNTAEQRDIAKESMQDAFKGYLGTDKGIAKENLGKAMKDTAKELKKTGSQMYDEFGASKWGQKRIFDPVQPQFVEKQYPIPRDALSPTTANLMDNTFGTYSQKQTRNPLTGLPEFSVNKQSKSATVSDYINLQKHLRDEAFSFRKRAKSDTVSKGDADILHGYAKSLNRLERDLTEKIEGTLPEKQQAKYQGIQDYWKEYVRPWEESATLSKMTKAKPSVRTANLLEKLDNEGHHALKKAFLENKELRETIGKHDWRKVNIKNIDKLTEALEGDLGKTLPANVKSSIEEHHSTLINSEKTVSALEKELKSQKLSKKDIDEKIGRYKSLVSKTGIGSAIYFAAKLLGYI